MKSRGGFASLLLLSVIFFLISLVEAIQLIPWWWILFLRCELCHHLRTALADNSLIMIQTSDAWIHGIFVRPFFPRCHPFPSPCMLNKNLYLSCICCSLCISLIVSESVSSRREHENEGRLEKAEINRTGAYSSSVCVCGGLVVNIGFLEYL